MIETLPGDLLARASTLARHITYMHAPELRLMVTAIINGDKYLYQVNTDGWYLFGCKISSQKHMRT